MVVFVERKRRRVRRKGARIKITQPRRPGTLPGDGVISGAPADRVVTTSVDLGRFLSRHRRVSSGATRAVTRGHARRASSKAMGERLHSLGRLNALAEGRIGARGGRTPRHRRLSACRTSRRGPADGSQNARGVPARLFPLERTKPGNGLPDAGTHGLRTVRIDQRLRPLPLRTTRRGRTSSDAYGGRDVWSPVLTRKRSSRVRRAALVGHSLGGRRSRGGSPSTTRRLVTGGVPRGPPASRRRHSGSEALGAFSGDVFRAVKETILRGTGARGSRGDRPRRTASATPPLVARGHLRSGRSP
jgi:hypothetical protein